jgi:hypothetical protein
MKQLYHYFRPNDITPLLLLEQLRRALVVVDLPFGSYQSDPKGFAFINRL